jgi:hypothetical protein
MGKLFVMLFAPPRRDFVSASWRILNFYSCTQDKFIMVLAPGHAHLASIIILHRDRFLASINLLPRHCTSALTLLFNRGQIRGSDKHCTATAPELNIICAMTAKSAPYPPFPANDKLQPDPGNLLWPELRRVTQPHHIAGPLATIL